MLEGDIDAVVISLLEILLVPQQRPALAATDTGSRLLAGIGSSGLEAGKGFENVCCGTP